MGRFQTILFTKKTNFNYFEMDHSIPAIGRAFNYPHHVCRHHRGTQFRISKMDFNDLERASDRAS